jgi:hypothetical protein
MINVSDKWCRENKETENLAFNEIMWKNNVERGRPQMAI